MIRGVAVLVKRRGLDVGVTVAIAVAVARRDRLVRRRPCLHVRGADAGGVGEAVADGGRHRKEPGPAVVAENFLHDRI